MKRYVQKPSKVWEQCHLSIGFSRSLPVFCHSQGQAMVLNKCAHKGLCLATYTYKCKTNHSNPWNQLFFFSDTNKPALDWFYQLWGSVHSTPHPEVRMAQKAVNQLVLSCKCVVVAQTVA